MACNASLDEFRVGLQSHLDKHRKEAIAKLVGMFESVVREARRHERVIDLTEEDDVVDKHMAGPNEESSNVAMSVETPSEVDTHQTIFEEEHRKFEEALKNDIQQIYESTLQKARDTAYIEMERNSLCKDEAELLGLGIELLGKQGKHVMKTEQLLSISTFLDEELPSVERACCKAHFKNDFAKKLKERKKEECKRTLKKAWLKRQNNYLGFAYMEADRPLMKEAFQELADVLQLRHDKHEGKSTNARVKRVKKVVVKKEIIEEAS